MVTQVPPPPAGQETLSLGHRPEGGSIQDGGGQLPKGRLRLPMALSQAARRAPPFPGVRWSSWGASAAGGARRDSPSGLYELLGVPPTATQAQIKTAYYKQSFLYHPDRNAGSEEAAERFTRVGEAYLVLGSVALRKKYDRGLLSRQDIRAAGKPSGKEAPSASPLPRRAQTFTASASARGKPIFDFDKFYREHYGEQLERERYLRARQQAVKRRKEEEKQWEQEGLKEIAALIVIVSAMIVLLGPR